MTSLNEFDVYNRAHHRELGAELHTPDGAHKFILAALAWAHQRLFETGHVHPTGLVLATVDAKTAKPLDVIGVAEVRVDLLETDEHRIEFRDYLRRASRSMRAVGVVALFEGYMHPPERGREEAERAPEKGRPSVLLVFDHHALPTPVVMINAVSVHGDHACLCEPPRRAHVSVGEYFLPLIDRSAPPPIIAGVS